jgi:hypothetical protein
MLDHLRCVLNDSLCRQVGNMMSDHVGAACDSSRCIPVNDVEDFVGLCLSQTVIQLDVEILEKLDWLNDGASGS